MYANLEPWAQAATGLALLALLAFVLRFVVQGVLMHFVRLWRRAMPVMGWAQILLHDHVLVRIAKVVPSLVVQMGIHWVEHLPVNASKGIANIATALTIYHVVRVVATLLSEINEAHDRHDGPKATQTNSIKSYVQLGKLIAYIVGALLIAASLMDRSPLLLLSGLGAMSAVLMLVFKDTILSFVAGVQISSNDMMRVGDWIEMPQVGADGFVVDIALNTVKVQNWDKTITTVPTWKLMSESFKNWRGMFDAGGRRILRSMSIDAATVHLLQPEERANLNSIALLQGYWSDRDGLLAQPESAESAMPTQAIAPEMVTNLAAFKAYAYAYLLAHPRIAKGPGMFLLARTLEPSPTGIPLQLYCYTSTTVWVEYEAIQGEIFDHLIGVLPLFGLSLYQRSSDYSNRQIVQALHNEGDAP
ncbi:MAG TPA: mechanosensitive ion channel domain-containing protein [Comamonas sp.]|uniref:mechanosensitive ion channel family protein n=1 Tax=Comamonas halotolerans TaxID=3041496 RepID=UPI0024E0909D|nr:mechanosensitive ion channel domain-containing protein [Comamonas sp. NoAH]